MRTDLSVSKGKSINGELNEAVAHKIRRNEQFDYDERLEEESYVKRMMNKLKLMEE